MIALESPLIPREMKVGDWIEYSSQTPCRVFYFLRFLSPSVTALTFFLLMPVINATQQMGCITKIARMYEHYIAFRRLEQVLVGIFHCALHSEAMA